VQDKQFELDKEKKRSKKQQEEIEALKAQVKNL